MGADEDLDFLFGSLPPNWLAEALAALVAPAAPAATLTSGASLALLFRTGFSDLSVAELSVAELSVAERSVAERSALDLLLLLSVDDIVQWSSVGCV